MSTLNLKESDQNRKKHGMFIGIGSEVVRSIISKSKKVCESNIKDRYIKIQTD